MEKPEGRNLSAELQAALERFGIFLANELPIAISLETMIARRSNVVDAELRLVLDLYDLVREQPIPVEIVGFVEGFIAAWSAATMMVAQIRRAPAASIGKVSYEAYSWLLAEMHVMLDYLEKWDEGVWG